MFNFARAAGLATIAALSIGASASVSQAAIINASSVDSFAQGTGNTVGFSGGIDPSRSNTANALGATDGDFLSLGIGGTATFSFGQNFMSPGAVVEITNGRNAFIETVDIFGIIDGVETFLASITNTTALGVFTFSGVFEQLKLVDTSAAGSSRDGFDVDSISVTPAAIPLPAGGLLLLGALGGIAALRRRKAA